MKRQVNGILLLDKPPGLSSNDALQKVKRLFNAKKAGHTGSLDPIATGMLPICFGEATKFSQFLLDSQKIYYVTARLGVTTKTGDSEGQEIAVKPVVGVTHLRIQQMLSTFLGESMQVPPMHSAIKHNGRPLYELARRNIEVERKARPITIYSIELDTFSENEFSFSVHCSKGTYVRTLVEDVGALLNCGAHVIGLHRVSVLPYGGTGMITLPQLEEIAKNSGHDGLSRLLLPVQSSVEIFPAVKLSTSAAFYLRMGQPVRSGLPVKSALVRLFSDDEQFLGVGEMMSDGRIKPHRLLSEKEVA
jgi:tRNA pseudouridine55 synthase